MSRKKSLICCEQVSLIALSGVDIGIRDLQFQNQGMQLSNSVTPCILEIEIKKIKMPLQKFLRM